MRYIKLSSMKYILSFLAVIFSVCVFGQYSPTGAKTRFVNGISLGTKLDAYFNTADSNAIYWRADSVLRAKYKGSARTIAFFDQITDTSILNAMFSGNSTGLMSGGTISIDADPTKFDISSGVIVYTDYTLPTSAVRRTVNIPAFNAVSVTNIGSQPVTYLAFDPSDTSIVQQSTPFTPEQRRSLVQLGLVVHSNLTSINAVNNFPATIIATTSQLHDFMNAIGPFTIDGVIYSPDGLQLDRSAGEIFKLGSNFTNNPKAPHNKSISAGTAITWRYRLQNSTEYVDTTFLDPNSYDNGGVRTEVPNNRWTVQRVNVFESGLTRIQFGQHVYQNRADAIAAINTESFTVEPNIDDNGLLRAFIVIEKGSTSIPDSNVLAANRFGTQAIGGGAATTTLQGAYNNSTVPNIITDLVRRALSIQRGTAADTDSVFVVRNGAGTVTSAITGDGRVLANKVNASDTIRTSGFILGANVGGVSTTSTNALTGNNTSTGRGLFAQAVANNAAMLSNTSNDSSAARIVNNGNAEIASFENSFGDVVNINNDGGLQQFNQGSGFWGRTLPTTLSANRTWTLPNASGTIALTSNVTDSSAALRASINTKLNISDTAAMMNNNVVRTYGAQGINGVKTFNSVTNFLSTGSFNVSSGNAVSAVSGSASAAVSGLNGSTGAGVAASSGTGQALSALNNSSSNATIIAQNQGSGKIASFLNNTTEVAHIDNSGVLTAGGATLTGALSGTRAEFTDSIVGVNQRLTGTSIAQGYQNTAQLAMLLNNSSTNNDFRLGNTGSVFRITDNTNTTGLFTVNNSGVTYVQSTFTANSDIRSNGIYRDYEGEALLQTSGSNTILGTGGAGTGRSVSIFAGNAERMTLATNGNITALGVYNATVGATNRDVFVDNTGLIGYVSSFRASKKNIVPLGSTSWIHQLNPVKFNYRKKDSTGKYTDSVYHELEYGLIAEEVEPINKELVFYDVDSTGKHLRGVHYSKLIIPLLKEVQEQKKTITALEARLARLEELLKIKP